MILTRVGRSHRKGLHSGRKAARLSCFARGSVIYIDDREFDLAEFGALLRCFAGWGMRIAFVPEDEVTEQPEIEVREPEDEED